MRDPVDGYTVLGGHMSRAAPKFMSALQTLLEIQDPAGSWGADPISTIGATALAATTIHEAGIGCSQTWKTHSGHGSLANAVDVLVSNHGGDDWDEGARLIALQALEYELPPAARPTLRAAEEDFMNRPLSRQWNCREWYQAACDVHVVKIAEARSAYATATSAAQRIRKNVESFGTGDRNEFFLSNVLHAATSSPALAPLKGVVSRKLVAQAQVLRADSDLNIIHDVIKYAFPMAALSQYERVAASPEVETVRRAREKVAAKLDGTQKGGVYGGYPTTHAWATWALLPTARGATISMPFGDVARARRFVAEHLPEKKIPTVCVPSETVSVGTPSARMSRETKVNMILRDLKSQEVAHGPDGPAYTAACTYARIAERLGRDPGGTGALLNDMAGEGLIRVESSALGKVARLEPRGRARTRSTA